MSQKFQRRESRTTPGDGIACACEDYGAATRAEMPGATGIGMKMGDQGPKPDCQPPDLVMLPGQVSADMARPVPH